MKKIFVFLLFTFYFSFSAMACTMTTAQDGVKLFKTPSIEAEILFDYPENFPLKIISESNGWFQVADWMQLKGWVIGWQLKAGEKSCVVYRHKVNFRSGPGRNYSVLGKLTKGNVLLILKKNQYWVRGKLVDPNTGQVGWVHRQMLWGD
ncbi:SH3 domain-containing protein [Candidatus Margulisiibacteriota bacterium]